MICVFADSVTAYVCEWVVTMTYVFATWVVVGRWLSYARLHVKNTSRSVFADLLPYED